MKSQELVYQPLHTAPDEDPRAVAAVLFAEVIDFESADGIEKCAMQDEQLRGAIDQCRLVSDEKSKRDSDSALADLCYEWEKWYRAVQKEYTRLRRLAGNAVEVKRLRLREAQKHSIPLNQPAAADAEGSSTETPMPVIRKSASSRSRPQANSAQAMAAAAVEGLKKLIELKLAPIVQRVNALEDRVEKVGGVRYRGVYRLGELYEKGDFCTHDGSVWHANTPTYLKPGKSSDWTLAVKKGVDAKTRTA